MTAQLQNWIYYGLMGVAVYVMFRRGGCCDGSHTVSDHTSGAGGCCGGDHQHGNARTDDGKPGPTTEMVRDPVCGMTIPKHEAIRVSREGQDYYFCSEDCANQFHNQGGPFINDNNNQQVHDQNSYQGHDHNNHQGHDHSKHMLLMVLCCMAPLLITFIAPRSGLAKLLSPLLFLMCPLSMLLMGGMAMRSGGKK